MKIAMFQMKMENQAEQNLEKCLKAIADAKRAGADPMSFS